MAKLFSDREIRAIAVFLPLAGLLIIALMLVRPAADPEAARRAEAEMEEALPADSVVMSPRSTTCGDSGLRSTKR